MLARDLHFLVGEHARERFYASELVCVWQCVNKKEHSTQRESQRSSQNYHTDLIIRFRIPRVTAYKFICVRTLTTIFVLVTIIFPVHVATRFPQITRD